MKKILSVAFIKNIRFPLKDISNRKPDLGGLLAIEHNKALLASYKQKIADESSKRLEAEQRAKQAEDEVAQLRAILATVQGEKGKK